MAAVHQPWLSLIYFFFVVVTLVDYSNCQSNLQNIETFYPLTSVPFQQSPLPNKSTSSSRKAVGTAVGVTAASTLVVAALLFFLFLKCRKRRKNGNTTTTYTNPYSADSRVKPSLTTASAMRNSFARFEKNLKGLIVDENGLDVVYWRKLEGSRYKNSYRKEVLNRATKDYEVQKEEEKRMIYKSQSRRKQQQAEAVVQEIPLLRGKSSTSQNPISPENRDFLPIVNPIFRDQLSSGISNLHALPIVNPIVKQSSSGITNLQALPIVNPTVKDQSSSGITNLQALPIVNPTVKDQSSSGITNLQALPIVNPIVRDQSSSGITNLQALPIVNPIVRDQSSSGITNLQALSIVNPIVRDQSSSGSTNPQALPILNSIVRDQSSSGITNLQAVEKQQSVKETPVRPSAVAISDRQSPQSPPRRPFTAVAARESVRAPPPPPPPPTATSSPAPPPPPPPKAVNRPVPPHPPTHKASSSIPPPPPFKLGSVSSSSKPPSAPKAMPKTDLNKAGKSSSGDTEGQVKLKPLHWDKVNADVGHSMVWDKLDGGSFSFDGDLMEALFGTVATNRKSPKRDRNANTNAVPSQIFILDSRRSQNIAIVLRSLPISRRELIDGLNEGQGLDTDTLEKISRITLTKEEELDILAFHGDPTRLAYAESFLYYLLKAIRSAFPRSNAMLFRSTYDNEIAQLKESLQVLELGCQELKTRGLFLKLLEAILKAGNRMNAGTARGNAHAFNLTSLRKLSDVKSTDGKTTLLHFVVEEVVRTEGKRCVLNRNRSLSRGNSKNSSNSGSSNAKEDKESEYKRLGLPVVGGLSAEFSNVKKAAAIDYDSLDKACSGLASRSAEIRKIVSQCVAEDEGRRDTGFVKQMRVFLEAADGELSSIREEQTRVKELVKRTRGYYQASASKDIESNPLQLFVIVSDFLGTVDQVCVEISRNLQKKRNMGGAGTGSSNSPARRSPVNFPNLPAHFMSDRSGSTSSDSSDGF